MTSSIKNSFLEIKHDLPKEGNFLFQFLYHFFLSPRFRVLFNHRIGKYFYFHQLRFLKPIAIYYKNRMITKRGCDISYHAKLGKKLLLPHPLGIVIGDSVVIQDHVTIFQHVTLGSHGKSGHQKAYPEIGNNVVIYAHAMVIGNVNIGKNAVIGAHSLVTKSVPENATAFGIPAQFNTKKTT